MQPKKPLLSVVMPCLNEQEAIGDCIIQIKKVFKSSRINGEIVVCDNGSTDDSAKIAKKLGTRLIPEPRPGYGRAYLTGFAAARGQYLIMADSDGTYDFNEIPNFLKKLTVGKFDFVSGKRSLEKNKSVMPFLHLYLGNPLLTRILNFFFGTHYADVYSGYRGFSRQTYEKIRPVSPGMEFNLELAINAKLAGLKVVEIPIVLHKRRGKSKLNTFRDGWKSLRIMVLYCPDKVFLWPGLALMLTGLASHHTYLTQPPENIVTFIGIASVILTVVGFSILNFGLHVKTYSWTRRFEARNEFLKNFYKFFKFELGLIFGALLISAGTLLLFWPSSGWKFASATLIIIGFNIIFSSLFISAMSLDQKSI